MTFYELLEAVIALLQQHGRVLYRILKRQGEKVRDDTGPRRQGRSSPCSTTP